MGWYDIDSFKRATDACTEMGRSYPAIVEIIVQDPGEIRHCSFFYLWLHWGADDSFCTSHRLVCSAIDCLSPPDFHTNYFHAANLIEWWIHEGWDEHIFSVHVQ